MFEHINHVAFCGGVTRELLYPGLAVAEQLRSVRPELRVTFCGVDNDWERGQIARAGYGYLSSPVAAWQRQRFWRWPGFLARHTAGRAAARAWLLANEVDAVVGLGGYSSVPMSLAAGECNRPLILLEQNVRPGPVNRWLADRAQVICVAFPETRAWLAAQAERVVWTGNPVRSLATYPATLPRSPGRTRQLLVLGGNRGTGELHTVAPCALAQLPLAADWRIVHQAGVAARAAVQRQYERLGLKAEVVGFATTIAERLAEADLVICRASGTTLAELACLATAAVVCPSTAAADGHQTQNARLLDHEGACLMVGWKQLEDAAQVLAQAVGRLMVDSRLRCQIGEAIHRRARPDAAQRVAEVLARATVRRSALRRAAA